MSTRPRGISRKLGQALGYAVLGALLGLLAAGILYLESRPDLEPWHRVDLDEEFTARSEVSSFEQYLELEERLFAQLETQVVAQVGVGRAEALNRFSQGSTSDPGIWARNWNRSFEWTSPAPSASVLLLHGMSDSPYSLRSLAERLHALGASVIGLRLPGHGTAPAGLVETRWQDMAAAVRLAADRLREASPHTPLYLVGYSNGGALAVNHALEALADPDMGEISGIVLVSPAIGVSSTAALAVWQARLGHALGLDKLAWNSISLEFDPFKYGSFAVNAGDQVHRLTARIRTLLDREAALGRLGRLPPILAFQSVVDATVSIRALVEGLLGRLPEAGHELVLFDINRRTDVEALLRRDPRETYGPMLAEAGSFALTVLTNESEQSARVVRVRRAAGASETTRSPLDLSWPEQLYSLSHIALPFPPDDPLYGYERAAPSPGIQLGAAALWGERGVLRISGNELLRLRWNPFYGYLERRILESMRLIRSRGQGSDER